ncbi:hypothetical protein QYM36_000211 [Artemia franciscana]|uniref:PiggyBac transposable element-derived protein domain-containing protein n=1 Tax=Artemia franciscana TaxID=6661 RepID=A0AA88IPV9_ARTSF|nr:hypothetical protein QYM36_000211 [Artemia franciscana]
MDFEPYIEYQQIICAYTPSQTESMSPAEYVSMFFSDEMTDKILLETNRYAMTKDDKFIDVTKQEICSYLSITLYMGIIRLPSYKLYWEKELNYTLVSGKMSLDSFALIQRYLHFNDNSKCKPKTDPGHDHLFKVRPIVDMLQENLMITEPEERHIILSHSREDLLCGCISKTSCTSGGSKYLLELEVVGACITLKFTKAEELWKLGPLVLVEIVDLVVHLKEIGYDCIVTIRQNRLLGCKLMEEKEMKRFRMGNVDWRVEKSTEVCLVRWYDNKAVTLVSNYVAVEPKDTCRRWDFSEKKYVEIERPAIKEYNKYMGGVD